MNAPKIKYEKFYFFIIPKRLAEIGLNGNNKKDTYYRINKKRKFQTAFLLGLMQNSLKK